MNILETTENMLLDRKEIYAEVENTKTPNFDEVKDMISKKLNTTKDNIVVKEVLGSFGKRSFKVTAFIYDTKEALEKSEGKIEKPAEQAPAPEAPAQPVPAA